MSVPGAPASGRQWNSIARGNGPGEATFPRDFSDLPAYFFHVRLWTLHPKYLDARGLVALWREALLARKVLAGKTKGYRHHPQLLRFAAQKNPPAILAAYLAAVHAEAVLRRYRFDAGKVGRRCFRGKLPETRGQLLYEWRHLKRKLRQRDPGHYRKLAATKIPVPHPLFQIVPGPVQAWEKVRRTGQV